MKALAILSKEDIELLLKLIKDEKGAEALTFLKKLEKNISRLMEPH